MKMSIRTRRAALAAALVATFGLSMSAMAADNGTITFNGKVISQTCSVDGTGGGSDFSVTLPVVQTSDLATSGAHTGDTAFSLALTNCPTNPSGLQVGTQFYSASNADTATGSGTLLNSTGSTYASNVDVQLLDGSSSPVTIGTAAPSDNSNVTDQTTLTSSGSATLNYTARYYATGAATSGLVATTVEYTINYQ